ncbi:MAG TPA: sigma-70 family RNA polymerase sigma factor [Candidatus Paceibacterota bacterium]|nr:sigma-70 family RNA polymerase sigma factor [Verrucomicrobiota bacterium]HRZ99334.1 sigma-70 family RNA polymerase sigma factor [Candidatus Paceibacterota bacterium]
MEFRTEHDLVKCCCAGDPDAWNILFDQHYAAVGRFVFQLQPDFSREDVEEICQEVFLSAIHHLPGFHHNSRLQTWLFRIAANKAADYRERMTAAKRGGQAKTLSLQAEPLEGQAPLDPPSPLPGPDAQLMTEERHAEVYRALDQLGQPCRELIELRYFGDLSYDDISATLKLNPKTVGSRLSRCLDQLESIVLSMLSAEDLPRFHV